MNLKLNGVYIPSFNKKINYNYIFNKPKKFNIIGSAHNFKEIKIKENKVVMKYLFLQSFKIKSQNILGLTKFNLLANKTKLKIIALGGINEKNYKKLKSTNSIGFGSISWAKKTA